MPGWSRTSVLRRRRTALFSTELRACIQSTLQSVCEILLHKRGGACGPAKPPAGVEPAPRPYKGRVLAVDTTEACAPAGGNGAGRSFLLREPDRTPLGARGCRIVVLAEERGERPGGAVTASSLT